MLKILNKIFCSTEIKFKIPGKFGRIHDLDVHGFSMGILEYFNIDVIIGWMFVFFIPFYLIHLFRNREAKLKFE